MWSVPPCSMNRFHPPWHTQNWWTSKLLIFGRSFIRELASTSKCLDRWFRIWSRYHTRSIGLESDKQGSQTKLSPTQWDWTLSSTKTKSDSNSRSNISNSVRVSKVIPLHTFIEPSQATTGYNISHHVHALC